MQIRKAPLLTSFALGLGFLFVGNRAEAQTQVEVIVEVGPAAPPPVVYQPAPPPVVYQPAPPPVVVYQPPPPVVYQAPAPAPVMVAQAAPLPPLVDPNDFKFALVGSFGGIIRRDLPSLGITGALRYRPIPHVAVQLGLGGWWSIDQNQDRVDVPVTFDTFIFVNPRSALQFYFVGGVGADYSSVSPDSLYAATREFAHVGGELGVGFEWRMGPHFAMDLDVRGFMRYAVASSDGQPEFAEVNDAGALTGRETNLSGGATLNLGFAWYL